MDFNKKNSKRSFSPSYMGFRPSEISWKRPQHYGCHMAQHWKG
jgi:hypothetical protein